MELAKSFVVRTDMPDRLKLAAVILGLSSNSEKMIADRWKDAGYPALLEYAPYAAHVLTTEIFYHISVSANLIKADGNSRVDIAYLFYLPFCDIFISSDKLHGLCAPLF